MHICLCMRAEKLIGASTSTIRWTYIEIGNHLAPQQFGTEKASRHQNEQTKM